MKLYTYWRSTASYRVRIVLELKGISIVHIPVHLAHCNGGEQHSDTYNNINPGHTVPSLVLDDGTAITQSLAIISYLDEICPEPALLPSDPVARAKVYAAAQLIVCDVHPLNNLRVIQYLKQQLGHDDEQAITWMKHWMEHGFKALEKLVDTSTRFCFGDDQPGLADICLVAQLYNAHRWGVDMERFQRLTEIEKQCQSIPAFVISHPDQQNDAETG